MNKKEIVKTIFDIFKKLPQEDILSLRELLDDIPKHTFKVLFKTEKVKLISCPVGLFLYEKNNMYENRIL